MGEGEATYTWRWRLGLSWTRLEYFVTSSKIKNTTDELWIFVGRNVDGLCHYSMITLTI